MLANHRGPLRPWAYRVAFGALLAWRVFLSFAGPSDSTDLYRNLAFSSHLPEWGYRFYEATPSDFGPSFWPVVWPKRPYQYPPAAAVFFAGFSTLGLGLAWVKLSLTACDGAAAVLLQRSGSPAAALLYLANPVSAFCGSHEGQFEPLQAVLIVAAAVCARDRRWAACGALVGLGVQVKLHSVLLLPWIAHLLFVNPEDRRRGVLRFLFGVGLSVLPFAGFYFYAPETIVAGVRYVAVDHHFNPYRWNPLDDTWIGWMPPWIAAWMCGASFLLLAVVTIAAVRALLRRDLPSDLVPYAGFCVVLKSARYVAVHYAIVTDAFVACFLPRRRLALGLLVLQLLSDPRSVLLLAGARAIGRDESDQTRAKMARCLFQCDWRQPPP